MYTDRENQPMYPPDVLLALAELRFIRMPSDRTKADALEDMKRQGLTLKQIVAFFKQNPRADFYEGCRELKKGVGYMTPIAERGEKTPTRSAEEIEKDNARAFAEERTASAKMSREALLAKLRAAGIKVEGV
jgi:hypothetical protein